MSQPPPSSPPPGSRPPAGAGVGPATGERTREIILQLQAERGWRRRAGELRLRGAELMLGQPGVLREPLVLAGGRVEVAAVDRSAHGRDTDHGRFPVLQRLGPNTILPFDQGIHGWVWTAGGGSSLPTLAEAADALPNLLLIFAKPLDDEEIRRCFAPGWVRSLADRSPLGSPSIPGLLVSVSDVGAAENAFRIFGVLGPITDREIPPTMRRHLAGDRPADAQIPVDEGARRRTSIAPPGMG